MFNFKTAHGPYINWVDSDNITYNVNPNGYRTLDFDKIDFLVPRMLVLGDSHSFGISNEQEYIWPEQLAKKLNKQLINLGARGVSADYLARVAKSAIQEFKPDIIFILWPDWSRFEYEVSGKYFQSLPTDNDRIRWMEQATNEWLNENFEKQRAYVKNLCKDLKLIDITLYDLIPYIDHADRWPLADNGSHFNHLWHNWVADIFYNLYEQQA